MGRIKNIAEKLKAANFAPRKFNYAPDDVKICYEHITELDDGGKIDFIADGNILRTVEFSEFDWDIAALHEIRKRGYDKKALYNLYFEDGDKKPSIPTTPETPELPGHVLSSKAFKESFYTIALVEKQDSLNAALLGNNPSKLHKIAVKGFKWTSELLKEAVGASEIIRDIVFPPEALQQIKMAEEKEKDSLELQEWFKTYTIDGKAEMFKERAVFGILPADVADNMETILGQLPVVVYDFNSKNEKSMAKTWSSLADKGGIGYATMPKEKGSPLTVQILLVIPEGFVLPK